MEKARITLKDIAHHCGLSIAAVSLGLRDHPSIPKATRTRIKKAAKDLDYVPDPVLSALVRYRDRRRGPSKGRKIAYLTYFTSEFGWRDDPFLRQTFEGAERRARNLGYDLEAFWGRAEGLTDHRLSQILQTRGIKGVIISPFPQPQASLDLDWQAFSCVAIGLSLTQPALHHVCANHYEQMLMLLKHLRELGYQRPGLILDSGVADRVLGKYQAAYILDGMRNQSPKNRLTPLLCDFPDMHSVEPWLRKHQPDVVISQDAKLIPEIHKAGFNIPADLAFASLNHLGEADIAGIDNSPQAIAAAAVDRLHLLLIDNNRGLPERPTSVETWGLWVEGASAPRRGST